MNYMSSKSSIGTKAATGQKCPESGVWKVDDPFETTTAPIAKGNVMPPYKGRAVTWILKAYA